MVDDERGRERQFSSDRETIRTWADEHEVVPVRHEETSEESAHRMVPEERIEEDHQRLEWDEFFEEFEDDDRVAVYHGETESEPVELAGRGDIATELDDADVEERLLNGETVTSTVTETAVVESVVTEELTVESELVDSETVEQDVVDAELLDREVRDVEIVEDEATDPDTLFDTDRYLDAVGGSTDSAPGGDATTFDEDLPYRAEGTIEETWAVTREATDRYLVESEITDAEVTEAESLEDYDLDVEGLHRTIAESGIIEDDLSTEEFLTEFDVESELDADDRVTTSFTRERFVEDELLDRREFEADVTGGRIRDMELLGTEEVAAEGLDDAAAGTAGTSAADSPMTGSMASDGATGDATAGGPPAGGGRVTDDDVGKTVVDPAGDAIGTVTGVDEGANTMYVDADPGLTERIKSALGWGAADEDDHRLDVSHVDEVTDDQIRLDHREDLGGDEAR